ncbi:MAG: hypothetical protein WAN11_10170 [Syntrophobacteraceae bacterium]
MDRPGGGLVVDRPGGGLVIDRALREKLLDTDGQGWTGMDTDKTGYGSANLGINP